MNKDGKKFNRKEAIASISILFIVLIGLAVFFTYNATKSSDSSADSQESSTKDVDSDDDTSSDDDNDSNTDSSSDSSSQSYGIGEYTGYTNGLKAKVDNVDYYDGNDVNTPDSGNQYAIIKVTIKNDSDESINYNPFDFHLNSDGDSVDTDEYLTEGPYQDLKTLHSGELDAGATKTGYLIGQASKDASSLQLRYKLNIKSDELAIDLK